VKPTSQCRYPSGKGCPRRTNPGEPVAWGWPIAIGVAFLIGGLVRRRSACRAHKRSSTFRSLDEISSGEQKVDDVSPGWPRAGGSQGIERRAGGIQWAGE